MKILVDIKLYDEGWISFKFKGLNKILIRAFLSDVSNVPNAKYLVHLTHQTQKQALTSHSKSQKIWHISTVPSQIWDGTDNNAKHCLAYLIRFFSLLHHSSLSVCNPSLSLSVWHSHRRLAMPPRHVNLTMSRDRDRLGSPLITNPLCDEEELQCEGHGGQKWKLPSATTTETIVLIWLSLLKGNKHWRRRTKKKGLCQFNLWF